MRLPPLPPGLVQSYGPSHSRVQRLDLAHHWQLDMKIAPFSHQSGESLSFTPDNQTHRPAQVGLCVELRSGRRLQACHPDPLSFQPIHGPYQVGYLGDAHLLSRAS